ncbi:hypothetical protein T484DRAFT_2018304 [Baffinella frigidus]|nr:hypothetical protein T484DRAFT_2018304 [Cryptophyta sp. CCMP2293]
MDRALAALCVAAMAVCAAGSHPGATSALLRAAGPEGAGSAPRDSLRLRGGGPCTGCRGTRQQSKVTVVRYTDPRIMHEPVLPTPRFPRGTIQGAAQQESGRCAGVDTLERLRKGEQGIVTVTIPCSPAPPPAAGLHCRPCPWLAPQLAAGSYEIVYASLTKRLYRRSFTSRFLRAFRDRDAGRTACAHLHIPYAMNTGCARPLHRYSPAHCTARNGRVLKIDGGLVRTRTQRQSMAPSPTPTPRIRPASPPQSPPTSPTQPSPPLTLPPCAELLHEAPGLRPEDADEAGPAPRDGRDPRGAVGRLAPRAQVQPDDRCGPRASPPLTNHTNTAD